MALTEITEGDRRRIRVVVVDDSWDVRFLIATILELDGRFEIVGEAHSAPDGCAVVAETDPDLVLVDLRLEGYEGHDGHHGHDGTWLIEQLRSRGNQAALAVVTGSAAEHECAAALAAGADSVHNKMSMTSTMVDELAASVDRRCADRAAVSA